MKKQYRDRITKAIFPDGDTVNYAYYEGKGINPGELIDLAETMPFFAKRRLIVVENSGFFKNATPDLADYIKTMPDTACFLFVENEADKRGKMYKAVKSKGRVVEMARQDEKTLLYWVAGNVKKRRLQDQGTDGQISSVNNRNGYGESGKRTGKTLLLLYGKRRD